MYDWRVIEFANMGNIVIFWRSAQNATLLKVYKNASTPFVDFTNANFPVLTSASIFLHFCGNPQFSFPLEISEHGFSTSGKKSSNNFFP